MMIGQKLDFRELLQQVYTSYNERNIDTALEVIHPHVDWANSMEGGFLQGHEELRDYWQRQWSYMDPHMKPMGYVVESDGEVVVDAHQIIRDMTGAIVSIRDVQHAFVIEDGMIVTMRLR